MNRDLQATRFQQTTMFWCWQKYLELNNFFVSLFEMENIAFFRLVNFIPCWIFALDTLYHTFGRVHEVRWDVTPVKFHSLNGLKVILQGLSILQPEKKCYRHLNTQFSKSLLSFLHFSSLSGSLEVFSKTYLSMIGFYNSITNRIYLNSDNPISAHFLHGLGDQVSNGFVTISWDCGYLFNINNTKGKR